MIGITSYGAYIPWHRIDRKGYLNAFGGFAIPGEKAVAGFDEDSITMGVEAGLDCLSNIDPRTVDGLLFSSTTSPYKEKQVSALMAMPLDMRADIRTADITNSLRGSTTALGMALDGIRAGSARSMLVIASDRRMAAPSGMTEQGLGDAAAALLLGTENVIAEVKGSYSISDEFAGMYRADDDTFVRAWEDRMVMDESYAVIMPEAINGLLRKCGISTRDITKAVFDPPTDIRRHGRLAKDLGLTPAQVADPTNIFLNVGLLGSAMSLMMLVSTLEDARPGDRILLASYGNGADAFLLEVTDAIRHLGKRRGFKRHLESKKVLTNYVDYLRWRDLIPLEAARRPEKHHISLTANWRERKSILGLWGVKCRRCGTPQYDNGAMSTGPIRICAECQAKDDFEDYCFARRKASIFSFTHDMLAPTIASPASVVLVEFDGGGRAFFDMTDRDPDTVEIGAKVEMTFRIIYVDRGYTNYFWKARPVRVKEA
ncbi:MAG: 3-hydroxy-3-methylglutaryl CoA synthase [Chloroflexi bacterium]|nr:3-hydroxy-3-methylglutaryl CoA synthase [Chloroflexota bacterium]